MDGILEELNNSVIHNSFVPSYDAETNSLNAVVITNSLIPRATEKGKYILQFSFEKEHVDLSRFDGAPFLKEHQLSLSNQIGVVEKSYLSTEQKKLTAKVKLSDNPDHAGIVSDIKNGIIRNCSVGAYIYKAEQTGEDESGTPIVLATSWAPYELSAVPAGADKNAHFFNLENKNNKEITKMENEEQEVINAGTETLAPQISADDVIKAERARISEITKLAKTFSLSADFADNLIANGADVNQARLSILKEVAKTQRNVNTRITTTVDSSEKFRAGLADSFVVRAGLKVNDGTNEMLASTPFEVAQSVLRDNGKTFANLSRNEIVKLAYQTSSDYQYACSNLVQTGLDLGLTEEMETWRAFAGIFSFDTMADARGTTLNRYETALEVVPENGEFHNITRSELSETYTPKKIGGISALSWEILQSDQLGLFADETKELGFIVSKTLSDNVYGVLFANAALSDGVALFHNTHKNLTTGAVAVASLSAAKALMTKNRSMPKYLITPVGIEDTAFSLINAINDPTITSGVSPNPHTKRFEVVSDYRLDDNSATIWYIAAANAVKVGFLKGQQKPTVETQDGFRIAGVEYRVMLPFAVFAPTYRGLVRSSGV